MDPKLEIFKSSNSKKLYRLTDRLFKQGAFNCYLTAQQFNLLDLILHKFKDQDTTYKVWNAFINSDLSLTFIEDEESTTVPPAPPLNKDSKSNNSSVSNNNNSTMTSHDSPSTQENVLYLKPGLKSSRNLCSTIRYLLYEKAIDYYFNDYMSERDSKNTLDFFDDDLDSEVEESDNTTTNSNGIVSNESKKDEVKTIRDEEDDYDDEEDDGDEEDDRKAESANGNNKVVDGNEDPMDIDNEIHTDDGLEIGPNGELTLKFEASLLTSKPDFPSPSEPVSSSDDVIGKMVHPILGTASAIESNIEKQNELKLIKNFNRVYHSFENDLPNIVKRRKLERSDKQLEMVSNGGGDSKAEDESEGHDGSESVNKLMELGGAANLSLKNLLGKIEESRDKLHLTDLELKNLIMDVRKNRSKWASYNKIGQEELYEACEKVVLELRGYTEHSTAFLNRVSKREAPNYYQIIKKPMDLNTVMKKLKNFQYTNKKEFVEDLMLIWNNCLTYNSDPSHFIRADAFAMQKKTLTLIPLIPDITVRDRSEVEREAALQAQQHENEDETKGATSTRGVGGGTSSMKKGKKTRKGQDVDEQDEDHDEPDEVESNSDNKDQATNETAAAPSNTEDPLKDSVETANSKVLEDTSMEATTKEKHNEKVAEEETVVEATLVATSNGYEEDQEDEDMTHAVDETTIQEQSETRNEDEDDEDLEMATWKSLTANTRYKLCEKRSGLFKEGKIQMNQEALLRDTAQMSNFSSYLNDSTVVLHKNRQYFDENDDPYLIEYDVSGGIPSIKYPGLDHESAENKLLETMINEGKDLDSLPESNFVTKQNGSNSVLYNNITLMQDIRRVCFKINIIRQMQASQFMHQSQFQPPEVERLRNEDIDPFSKLSTRDPMTSQIAFASLKRSVSTILMANGFESADPFCATIVTQTAEQYMGNLARSIKLHLESSSINKLPIKEKKPLNFKDILLMALNENGIEKPDVLYSFYKEHLSKQHRKLKDLKFKLESFLRDLLRPGIQEISEGQFTDDSEQFVNGDFSNEIGEDFFGFKELGLDKEFGLLTSTIPLHLLHSKLANQFSSLDSKSKKARYEDFEELKFPKLRKRDLPNQIGLLKPFYDDLLMKSKAMYSKQLKKHQSQAATQATDDSKSDASTATGGVTTTSTATGGEEAVNGTTTEQATAIVPQLDPQPVFIEIKDPEDLIIIEDDDLPQKQRNNRPKIPPNGKITQIKKKFIANAFFLDAQDLRENADRESQEAQNTAEKKQKLQKEDVQEVDADVDVDMPDVVTVKEEVEELKGSQKGEKVEDSDLGSESDSNSDEDAGDKNSVKVEGKDSGKLNESHSETVVKDEDEDVVTGDA
ncbi:hypothetical protein CANARDRAFT_29006 [[Candida] arabinofermentans NRRL YB-2248]|uniref:SAGA complex subunit Spt7 n=1 Tax=[Candida] arabinofermentans NRRL YB-2248 TaxID=983967 RepID=A0A1E4SY86_9ASCO|nr:hypothetical protein CANARDRAFT_29006 [[Candida] arabinofermentans NRRL YB-2248]